MSTPRCSFHPEEGTDPHGVVMRRYVEPDDAGLCGAPPVYTVTSLGGVEADLCVVHAAHVRACPACTQWLASIRTFGLPPAGGAS